MGAVLLLLLLAAAAGPVSPAKAQESELSGLVFGDYYWMASHHDEAVDSRNGFWIRRIYLTFDRDIGQNWAVRVRGEMNQPGDFTSSSVMTPFVKDAYLQWESGQHTLRMGLAPTPTFSLVEDWWGYRPVEKTPLDLYRFGSTRDLGISAQGHLGEEMPVRYHAMVGNGSGTGAEINNGKKAMLSLAASPLEALTLEVYGDLEETDQGGYYTFQGALYYQHGPGRLGLQYAHQTQYQDDAPDAGFDIVSVFGRVQLNENVSALARLDRQFQPHPGGQNIPYLPLATNANANFVLAGLDFSLNEQVHLIPNIEAVFYDSATGETPNTLVLPRLTLFYTF